MCRLMVVTAAIICLCINLGHGEEIKVRYNLNQDPRLSEDYRKRNAEIVNLDSTCIISENPVDFLNEYSNCTEYSIGSNYFRSDYLDEKVFGFIIEEVCSNRVEYSGCLDQFYSSLKKNCLSPNSTNLNLSGSDGLKNILKFICEDDGKQLISVYTRGDEKCVKRQQKRIQECIEHVDLVWTISIGLVLEPVFYFDSFMCKNYGKFETCILKNWENCESANDNKAYVTKLLSTVKEPSNCTNNHSSDVEKPDSSFEHRLHHYQQILACPLIDINVEFGDFYEKCLKHEGINMTEFYRGSFEEFENETLPIIKEKYCPHYDKAFKCLDIYFENISTCLNDDNTHFGTQGYLPIKALIKFVCEEGHEDLLKILNKEGQTCMDEYRSEFMACGTVWDEAWQSKMPFFILPYLYIDSEVESDFKNFHSCLMDGYKKCNSDLANILDRMFTVAENAIYHN